MATVSKQRNQANTGVIISIEVLDAESEGMTSSQTADIAFRALREAIAKRARKEGADELIARAQADKAASTEL